MYLFLAVLASQVALHSWLHVSTYQKNKDLEFVQLLKQLPLPIQFKIFQYKMHGTTEHRLGSFSIITPAESQELMTYKISKGSTITPTPITFDSRLFDQFYQYQSKFHTARYGRVQFSIEKIPPKYQIKQGSTCQIGPNKNDFVFYEDGSHGSFWIINNKKSFPKNIITSKQHLSSDFLSPYCYAYALAYYKNRYAIITRKNQTQTGVPSGPQWQDTIEIHDFTFNAQKIESEKIAAIPLETLIPPPHYSPSAFWHNLSFIGTDVLFFIGRDSDNSLYGTAHLYKSIILNKKDNLSRPQKIADSVISFAAHPALPLGFMLKKINDETYWLYVVNACTKRYKKIKTIKAEKCPICEQSAFIPRDMTYDGYTLGIKFLHVGGNFSLGTSCSYSSDIAWQLKTMPISIYKI